MTEQTLTLTRINVYETLCPNRCEPSIEVIMKIGIQWRGGGGLWGCQGGSERERRIEVSVKFKTNRGRGGGGRVVGGGGQGGCERRSEVFVEIQKKKMWGGGSGGGVKGGGGQVGVSGWM